MGRERLLDKHLWPNTVKNVHLKEWFVQVDGALALFNVSQSRIIVKTWTQQRPDPTDRGQLEVKEV